MKTILRPSRTEIENATRRQFIGVLAAAGILSACGSADDGAGTSPAPSTRGFVDDLGRDVQVPERPRRIVAFNEFAAGEAVLSLGGTLVGLTDQGDGSFNRPTAEAYDLTGITSIGGYGQEDAEAIALLRPDLIIGEAYGGSYNHAPRPEVLQQIAPTIIIDPTGGRDHFLRRVAEALGAEDELQRQKDEYLLRAREVAERLPEGLSVVALVGIYEGELVVYSTRSQNPLAAALVDIGVTTPAATEREPDGGADYVNVSLERMLDPDLQADVIVSEDRGDRPQAGAPLWSRMPAVAAGQAHEVAPPAGTSYRAGLAQLDVLEPLLVSADPTVVA
jgi:iron complex transport system substrate-binding protein